jgi:hypothetical protein
MFSRFKFFSRRPGAINVGGVNSNIEDGIVEKVITDVSSNNNNEGGRDKKKLLQHSGSGSNNNSNKKNITLILPFSTDNDNKKLQHPDVDDDNSNPTNVTTGHLNINIDSTSNLPTNTTLLINNKTPSPSSSSYSSNNLSRQPSFSNNSTSNKLISNLHKLFEDLLLLSSPSNNKLINNTNSTNQLKKLFVSKQIPKITLQDYLIRIIRYINRRRQQPQQQQPNNDTVTTTTDNNDDNENENNNLISSDGFLAVCGAYLLLLNLKNTIINMEFTLWTIHRAILTASLIAHKMLDDHCSSNYFFSRIGDIPITDMNQLELEFCLTLNFNIHVVGKDMPELLEKLM